MLNLIKNLIHPPITTGNYLEKRRRYRLIAYPAFPAVIFVLAIAAIIWRNK